MTVEIAKGSVAFFCLNLRFGMADDGPNCWERRKKIYPQLLEQNPADFYAFQEANDFQTNYLHDILKGYGIIGQRCPAPEGWQNNVIFYNHRWKCLEEIHFYLSNTPEVPSKFKESRWPRQCTLGTFGNGRDKLTVVNTHFDFEADVQRQSALLIADRLKDLPPGHPVVLMGDFNAGPHSSCLITLQSQSVGFKSGFLQHDKGTYHGFTGVAQNHPIDWILYRGNIQRSSSRILTDTVEGIYPSDHFPLSATFRII